MTLTIDLRHLAFGAACAALGVAVHAFAAPAAPTKSAYEFRCIGAAAAKIDVFVVSSLNETNGWNPYLAKMATEGWEPTQFIVGTQPITTIQGVCLRRLTPAAAPAAPPMPEGPRCTPADQAEMKKSGMSESAIKAACEGR